MASGNIRSPPTIANRMALKTLKPVLVLLALKVKNFGSFDYGRNYGVIYDVAAWTDMLPEFGDDTYIKTDNFMTGRANGVATYRNNDFFAWSTA
ncbi:Porin OmpN [Serratia fonticola]|uniref:Porin OmpN n=1 Tax=Serratia fonticola TaxID=47917 RepID=A0A4V6Z348_SERFO|nr:Porin OmpN [Serratia fonticola]